MSEPGRVTPEAEEVVDGVVYVTRGGYRYAKCCGWATCVSECKAIIYHGPGHQSKTHCRVKGPHEIHEAVVGSYRQFATWRDDQSSTDYFDQAPEVDE